MKRFTKTDEDNGFLTEHNIIIPGGKFDSDENPEILYREEHNLLIILLSFDPSPIFI